jgi:hypothetical protein
MGPDTLQFFSSKSDVPLLLENVFLYIPYLRCVLSCVEDLNAVDDFTTVCKLLGPFENYCRVNVIILFWLHCFFVICQMQSKKIFLISVTTLTEVIF